MNPLMNDELFRTEGERLAKMKARDREQALAVHWRIANDSQLARTTRDYARQVAETLEAIIKDIRKTRK